MHVEVQKLSNSEDSLYRSRRSNNPHYEHQKRTRSQYDTGRPDNGKGLRDAAGEASQYDKPYERATLVVELNEADSLSLQLLRGVGPARARAIVRYRERLGGFVKADQLLEVWGIDSTLLPKIEPYLRIDSNRVRRLGINRATIKELARHPYMDYYMARDIVALRQQGVLMHGVPDLLALPSCDTSALARLLPYLDFDTAIRQ